MQFANLRNTLKTEIKPAYVLTGSDIFLVNKAIELILAAAKINPLNVIRFDESHDANEINALSRNESMFGGPTATIVRSLTDTRIILQPGTKVFEPVDCNPMTSDLVTKLAINQFSQSGKTVNQDSAAYLAASQNNDYARVNNEIIKLISYYNDKKELSLTDIESLITKTEEFQIYELGNALLKKDTIKAKIICNALSKGTDDYAIFANLLSLTRRLFYALCSPASDSELASFLKVHPYAVTASRRDGKHLRVDIMDIYRNALDLEYQIKTGRISAEHALVLLQGSLL